MQEERTNEFARFLGFETVTFWPFAQEAILVDDLTNKELEWLNDYHTEVYRRLEPLLDVQEKVWLKEKTKAMAR